MSQLGIPAGRPDLDDRTENGRRIYAEYPTSDPNGWGETRDDRSARAEARCAEIYAVRSGPAVSDAPPAADDTHDPARRRVLVPGPDRTTSVEPEPRDIDLPYMLQVRAKWDSPTIVDEKDWIPVLVELLFDWQQDDLGLPDGMGNVTPESTVPAPPGRNGIWRFLARFTHDPRGGRTEYTVALDTPGNDEGIARFTSTDNGVKALGVALGLGPALLSGVESSDPGSSAVRVGGLLAAIGVVLATDVVKDAKVALQKIEIGLVQKDVNDMTGSVTRVLVDYTVELGFETDLLGVETTKPAVFRYKGVGIEYTHDPEKEWYEGFDVVYEDSAFEIVNPGVWHVDGALGELLGISAVRLGSGSMWVETDLDFAIDLGVIEISSATIRVTISDSVLVDLRGLALKVDVPGILKGSGALQIGDGGDFSAAVDLTIIPAEIQAVAALKLQGEMTQLEAGIRFASAIPLGGTGFGIYGFIGRFVTNGTRDFSSISETDPVERELAWYATPVLQKYTEQVGQNAIGFGVVVGTMPDTGFSFNATGMLTIGFPDISVVLSIDAKFMKKPELSVGEDGGGSGGSTISFGLLGVVAIDSSGVAIGVRGELVIEKVLRATIPISAYFPLSGSSFDAYLRIGSDGIAPRAGSPITLTVLPDILDVRAWSFFMIEEKKLEKLGGHTDLNFYGFSIGFGAGWELKYGGGPIYVSISSSVLVGLGTKPLALGGAVMVKGELWLVIIGLSISAELVAIIIDRPGDEPTFWKISGKICGKVSFFFFSIEGCVDFALESGGDEALAHEPEPLVGSLTLTDRFIRVIADGSELSATGTGSIEGGAVAWPDVAPTLHFSYKVLTNLPGTGFTPSPENGFPGEDWAGTSNVKYRYRLDDVALELADGTPVDTSGWPSVWWLPAFRAAFPDPGDAPAGDHEGWDLALLHWDPSPWRRSIPDGGDGLEADPADAVSNLCEPAPETSRHCALGQDGERQSPDRVRYASAPTGALPYPSHFILNARETFASWDLATIVELASTLGLGFAPGTLRSLPVPFSPGGGPGLTEAFQFPYLIQGGRVAASLGVSGDIYPAILDPELTLSMCVDVPHLDRNIERCVDFAELQPHRELGASTTVQGVLFTDRGHVLRTTDSLPAGTPDGKTELRFTSKGLDIALPEASDRVRMSVGYQEQGPVAAVAFDTDGARVAEAIGPATPNVATEIALEGPGIVRVVLVGGFGTGMLERICYRFRKTLNAEQIAKMLSSFLAAADDPQRSGGRLLPKVYGVLEGTDTSVAWMSEVVDIGVGDGRACIYLRYTTEDREARWDAVKVLPFPRVQLSFLSLCGVSADAQDAHDADEDAREDSQDAWNDAANGDEEDRVALLEAGTDYRIRIDYVAAVWAQNDTANPPSLSAADFDSTAPTDVTFHERTQYFGFRTAPEGAIANADLLTFDAQALFEPAALQRYLIGFDPESDRFTHFLDDELLVHFDVEWVPTLLAKYGYEMKLAVKRTDPTPPDPGAGEITDLSVPSVWTWEPLPVWMRAVGDIRVAQAADLAPCLDVPPAGGMAAVSAHLDPRAEYDLILSAVNLATDEEVYVSRTHFRTSRYRLAGELVESMGFGPTSDPVLGPPVEILIASDPTAGSGDPDDLALDECLAAMGVDPLPLPSSPRTVVFWIDDGGTWKLAGVLLDADESLFRAPRLEEVVDASVSPGTPPEPRLEVVQAEVGGHVLSVRHRNEAGTRVLLAPPAPVALSHPTGRLPLSLSMKERGSSLIGVRTLTTEPYLVTKESV